MEEFANDDLKKIAAFMLVSLAISGEVMADPLVINTTTINPVPITVEPATNIAPPKVLIYAPYPGTTNSTVNIIPNVVRYAPYPGTIDSSINIAPQVVRYAPYPNINWADSVKTNIAPQADINNVNMINEVNKQALPINNNVNTYSNYGNVQIIDNGRHYIFK